MKLSLHTIKKSTAPLVWLLAGMLLFFPVSVHALPGIVLCIESDGRIEIENSRTGDCAQKIFARAQEMHAEYVALEATDIPGTDCRSSCVDILLFASPADGQAASTLKHVPQESGDLCPPATLHAVPNLDASTRYRAGMLLFFPVSVHALPGIVLCIESDGRIEIENSRTGDCAQKIFARAQEMHAEYVALEATDIPGTDCRSSCNRWRGCCSFSR